MIERKISSKKYLVAFILTILVFLGGIIIGIVLENVRLEDAKKITLAEKVNLQSLQIQQDYVKLGLADCKTLNKILEVNINELDQKMRDVIDYEKKSIFNNEAFNLQLREYFLTEIQFLLVSDEINQKCEKDSLKIIYFYNEDINDVQGNILDYLKKLFGEKILVFSFNSRFTDEPMINVLTTSYDLKKYPSVIIEDKVFQGLTSVEVLMKTICDEFKLQKMEVPTECGIFNK